MKKKKALLFLGALAIILVLFMQIPAVVQETKEIFSALRFLKNPDNLKLEIDFESPELPGNFSKIDANNLTKGLLYQEYQRFLVKHNITSASDLNKSILMETKSSSLIDIARSLGKEAVVDILTDFVGSEKRAEILYGLADRIYNLSDQGL